MESIIQAGTVEPVTVLVLNSEGVPLTGKTDIKFKVWRTSDRKYLDFRDMTFKVGSGVADLETAMTEVDSAKSPGEYFGLFDTGAITNPLTDDAYQVVCVGGPDAANLPVGGEVKVGYWVRELLQTKYTLMQSYSYDPRTGALSGLAWLESKNFVVLDPTFCSVSWYTADGALLFTMEDGAPDAQGIFHVTKAAAGLEANKAYYTVATVAHGAETITATKGSYTLG